MLVNHSGLRAYRGGEFKQPVHRIPVKTSWNSHPQNARSPACRQNDTDTTTTCRAENCWTRVLLSVCIETWRLPKRKTIPLALPLHGWTKTRRLRAVTVYLDRHTALYCFGHCCQHTPRRHVQPFSAEWLDMSPRRACVWVCPDTASAKQQQLNMTATTRWSLPARTSKARTL